MECLSNDELLEEPTCSSQNDDLTLNDSIFKSKFQKPNYSKSEYETSIILHPNINLSLDLKSLSNDKTKINITNSKSSFSYKSKISPKYETSLSPKSETSPKSEIPRSEILRSKYVESLGASYTYKISNKKLDNEILKSEFSKLWLEHYLFTKAVIKHTPSLENDTVSLYRNCEYLGYNFAKLTKKLSAGVKLSNVFNTHVDITLNMIILITSDDQHLKLYKLWKSNINDLSHVYHKFNKNIKYDVIKPLMR